MTVRRLTLPLLLPLAALTACEQPQPPPLASGVDMKPGVESAGWTGRLAERFPVGTPEARLVAGLRAERFEVEPAKRSASYGWAPNGGFPCSYTLTVDWTVDQASRVSAIRGGYLNACT